MVVGKPVIDLTGQRFERVLVLKRDGSIRGRAAWLCRCDCGTEWRVASLELRQSKTKSCGCYAMDKNSQRLKTHGASGYSGGTKAYRTWKNMKARTSNPNNHMYYRYGGRGIKVCDRWLHSFENFLADVGEPPSDAHTIDRIDNDGNYEPGNVRWETRLKQANNQTHGGSAGREGERNYKAKLKAADIRHIRGSALNVTKLAELYGVTKTNISMIRHNKIWRHVK